MIHLAGTAKRSYLFPGSIHEALDYYANMETLFTFLPHITVHKSFSKTQFRVLFTSIELGLYKIQLYCDLVVNIDPEQAIITVGSLNGMKAVRPKAGLHSSQGTAKFVSTSRFASNGDVTRIYYHLNLKGELPKPLALSLVPDSITNHIADNIAKRRIHEIADGFILGTVRNFKENDKASSPN